MSTVDAAIIKHITRGNLTGSGSNGSNSDGVTKEYIDTEVAKRAPIEHNHDDSYYTKGQVDAKVGGDQFYLQTTLPKIECRIEGNYIIIPKLTGVPINLGSILRFKKTNGVILHYVFVDKSGDDFILSDGHKGPVTATYDSSVDGY